MKKEENKPKKRETTNMIVHIMPQIRDDFREYCKDRGSNMTTMIRGWIMEALRESRHDPRLH